MINTWPGWENMGLLGEGSFGKVYKIKREEFGQTYEAALKVITIPASQGDVRAAYDEGMDEESVTKYFHSFVEDIVAEFALMSQMKGNSNIVSYEDHMVIQREEEVGWDILIRMELLTALPAYAKKNPLQEEDVIRLGIHMTRALELCRNRGIIHRDIKPENIFVSRDGDFKLGDFGVARVAEKTITAMSRKGTYNFMAPEVYKGEKYGYAADICSLGLVLYRYLNDNRTPFLPPYPQPIQYSDRENALEKRMSGEDMPVPAHGSARLQEIVLKACAYRPEDRYGSPEEMRMALECLQMPQAGVTADEVSESSDHKDRKEAKKAKKEKADRKTAEKKTADKTAAKESRKKPAILQKGIGGLLIYLGVFMLGTLLFAWDTLYDPGSYMDVMYYSEYQAFRGVVCTLMILLLPMVAVWRKWPRLWQAEGGRKGTSIAAVVLLMVIGLILASMGGFGGLLMVLGSLGSYPVQAILAILLVAGAGVLWHLLEKKQQLSTQWAGMLITILVFVFVGILVVTSLYVYDSSISAYTMFGELRTELHYEWETPSVLLGTFFQVLIMGLVTILSGRLWNMEKKAGKLLWGALLVAGAILIFRPVGWIMQIVVDLRRLPMITVIGLVLGVAAIWGLQKLAAILKRKKGQKAGGSKSENSESEAGKSAVHKTEDSRDEADKTEKREQNE